MSLGYRRKVWNEELKIIDTLGTDLIPIINKIPGGVILIFPSYEKMKNGYKLWKTDFENKTKKICFKEEKGEKGNKGNKK